MTHLTSSPPSRHPRYLHLFGGTAFPGRAIRISHVHCLALMTCRALRPRGCPTPLPKTRCRMLSSGKVKPSTIPHFNLNGALSLQPEGLRPITSLSTLNPHGYPYRPKTRYQVRWVTASWAALAAASKTAPRGAQPFVLNARPERFELPTTWFEVFSNFFETLCRSLKRQCFS